MHSLGKGEVESSILSGSTIVSRTYVPSRACGEKRGERGPETAALRGSQRRCFLLAAPTASAVAEAVMMVKGWPPMSYSPIGAVGIPVIIAVMILAWCGAAISGIVPRPARTSVGLGSCRL